MESKQRLSIVEWDALLAEQEQSGMSIKGFCLDHGIKPTSFHSAQKRKKVLLKAQEASDAGAPNHHASRRSAPAAGRHSATNSFVALHVSETSCAATHPCEAVIRVQLRGGHQLWVCSGFDAAHLSRLVAVLESAS